MLSSRNKLRMRAFRQRKGSNFYKESIFFLRDLWRVGLTCRGIKIISPDFRVWLLKGRSALLQLCTQGLQLLTPALLCHSRMQSVVLRLGSKHHWQLLSLCRSGMLGTWSPPKVLAAGGTGVLQGREPNGSLWMTKMMNFKLYSNVIPRQVSGFPLTTTYM